MEILLGAGLSQVAAGTPADVQIVNTCTVTREADRKSAQMVRRAERLGGQVVATGCGVAPRGGLRGIGATTLRLLPDQRESLLELLGAQGCPSQGQALAPKRHRAVLRVQEGCDQFCTFCIVPYVRGRSRSFPAAEVLEKVRGLQAAGFREIVLSGINLSSCLGSGLLSDLLEATEGVRFRLSSVEPNGFPREIFQLMARYPERLCPHLHLVLQHASDRVLERMHRGYTLADYHSLVQEFVATVPGACLTTDVMVGFPGETDEDFQQLRAYVERTPYYHLHVFPYSPRPGTTAAKFAGQVEVRVKQARRDELLRLGNRKRRQFQKSCLGQVRRVLVEECTATRGWVQGTADNFLAVQFKGEAAWIGEIVEVELLRVRQEWVLAGFHPGTEG